MSKVDRLIKNEVAPVLIAGTLLFACASPVFAEEEGRISDEFFGFGAITDDMIITRDLTVRTTVPSPFAVQADGKAVQNSETESSTTVNLLTAGSEAQSALDGSREDDSYIITEVSTQKLNAIGVCAAPALMDAFALLPKSETSCGVLPLKAGDRLDVKEGTALIVADRDMEIGLRVGILKLSQGSVVLVSNTENGTAIFDFHDRGKGAVALAVGDRSVCISPGRHLHASLDKASDFASVNGLDRIAHRRVTSSAITDGVTIHSSEFSTLSALEAVEPLKKVMASSHPEARKLAQQVIKTSAVLMMIGSGAEDYKIYARTRMTSLVNPN